MQNNMFLKIITIFLTVAFILEMIPLQALAFNASYPIGMSNAWAERKNSPITWQYICNWGINPPGYESDIQKGADKEIFGNTHRDSGGYDSISRGYYEDGIANSSPTASIITTSFNNVQQHTRLYTAYGLKTDRRGRVSNKAEEQLYQKNNSCCPDGNSDQCKTGTTKECLVNYCLSNPSDCNQVQKTETYYTYNKIDETKGGTFYSSEIIDSEAVPLQAELTKRKAADTRMTTPDGEIVGCGTRGSWRDQETKVCPAGTNISADAVVSFPDGSKKTVSRVVNGISDFFGGGWDNYIFVSANPSTQIILAPETITQTNQNVVNPQTLVKSFAWTSAGCDKDEGIFGSTYYCHKGLRANYLLADGSTLDGHYWWTTKKSVTNWGPIGFIVGWILNIILPGSGFLIFAGLGDLVFMGSLFIPGANISVTLADLSEVSLCSAIPVPPEVSQPTISAQKTDCNATNANVTLSLTPDSTKTGKVTGYELYRQNADGTGKVLIKKETSLSIEQSQSVITIPDTVLNDKIYLYSVSLTVTNGTKTIAIATINTGICTLSCSKFSALPSTIIKPAKSTLSWICTGATNCRIDPSVGNVSNSGSTPVQPDKTTTYTLICDGGISRSTTVTVLKPGYCEINPSGDGCE